MRVFLSWLGVSTALGILWLIWHVSQINYYKSGDTFGYNLGLVGGLLMLFLLSYPLRKRLSLMRRWGQLKIWFWVHMTCGILGPLLIIFHSKLHLKSVNASVAFYSMVLVAGSGFIGKYAYKHIHRGMYGSLLSVDELKSELFGSEAEAESKLKDFPKVLLILHRFHHYAIDYKTGFMGGVVRFFALPVLRSIAILRCKSYLPTQSRRGRELHNLVLDYLYGVERYARFGAFERIFALWHVIHIPLVYLLAGTSMWHVVAVHMY